MSQVQVGDKLGSFRLQSVLGAGAMGVVYRGVNEATGKTAAVKVVSGEISQRSKVYDRFMREAEILKQFRHPNIVRFLAVGRYQGVSYIAMEFIQGDTLDKILDRRGAIPWREVVDLAIQLCEALHYAHEHGVVHRDLKPSNLMVTHDGKLKLTDFGIAKDLDATALTATGRTLGTAAYMAPEQIRGTPAVSHKTDLYALGIVLYQLLVGRLPFEGGSPMILMHNHLNEPPPRPSDKVEEIPVAVDGLVVALMAKDPADRPWDAAAVAHSLTELKAKSEAGKTVKMVWTQEGAALNPERLGATSSTRDAAGEKNSSRDGSRSRKGGGKDGGSRSGGGVLQGWASALASRAGLETMGLALALVGLGGLMAYLVWPPGVEYLYQHAKPLMASTNRHDWLIARDEFIEPLDRRFPDHQYRDETRSWRDKILLDEADSRSKIITSPIKTGLSNPINNTESLYVITYAVAAKASERHDDLEAMHQWESFAEELKPDDAEQRPWRLLAEKRADDLKRRMRDRRELVLRQIDLVEKAFRGGRPVEATTLQAKLFDEFAPYTDLADLFSAPPDAPRSAPDRPGEPKAPSAVAGRGDGSVQPSAAADPPPPKSETSAAESPKPESKP